MQFIFLSLALSLVMSVPARAYDMGKVGEYNIVSASTETTAAVDEDGSLWMWGENQYGPLGAGEIGGSNVPVKVMDGVVSVSCSESHTAAIDEEGTLWMWGWEHYNATGIGTVYYTPVQIMEDVAAVSCSERNVAIIKTDGSLWVCGSNFYGQLCDDTISFFAERTTFEKIMDHVTAVSCGDGYIAAIKTDGTLWMWGKNEYGVLGNGGEGDRNDDTHLCYYQTVPIQIMEDVTAVYCGTRHTAAIKQDGSLWAWGTLYQGTYFSGSQAVGNGVTEKSYVPVKIMDDVATASCGLYHTAAIKTDGSLWMWGQNYYGQLGNGTTEGSNVPVKIMDNVAAVSCGGRHTIAVQTDGSVWTWGTNPYNAVYTALGHEDSSTPVRIELKESPVKVTVKLNGGEGENELTADEDGKLTPPADPTREGYIFGGWYMDKDFIFPWDFDGKVVNTLVLYAKWIEAVKVTLNTDSGGQNVSVAKNEPMDVPANPIREGYTFGGWYTDPDLTTPWNFNDKVVNTLTLYARWVPVSSTAAKTGRSSQAVTVDGAAVTLDAYTLAADSNGGDVTYVKLRDIAALLEDTDAKFNVDWQRGAIYVTTKSAYTTKNGGELKAISGTDGSYKWNQAPVLFDGTTKALEGIVLTDGQGGGHTFFKLRDLGEAIGFTVGWTAERGIFIETK